MRRLLRSQAVTPGVLRGFVRVHGLGALLRFFASEWRQSDILVRPRFGGRRFEFASNLDQFAFYHLACSWPKLEALVAKLEQLENPIVLDVGANLGVFSFLCHHRCPSAEIHAFEPARPALAYLRRNVGDFAVIREAACGERDARVEFHEVPSGLPSSSLDPERIRHLAREVYPVEMIRLDGYLQGLKLEERPLVVKIDVQGAERRVLRGLGDQLDRVDLLLLESTWFDPDSLRAALELIERGWPWGIVNAVHTGADLWLRNPARPAASRPQP